MSKRLVDLSCALTALVLLAPLLVVLVCLIKASAPGPVFYVQRRVGFGGRLFPCLKFRTMVPGGDRLLADLLANDAAAAREWAVYHKLRDDPRITRLGRFLRITSLDELPQLLNVVLGQMSLVGPRPIVSDELPGYGMMRGHYLRARPGLTGLWQISGRSNVGFERRVALDCAYVTQWSTWTDIKIMLLTVVTLLRLDEAR